VASTTVRESVPEAPVTPDSGPRNMPPGGFPLHRMPAERLHRAMPAIASPADAAARSVAARNAAANAQREASARTSAGPAAPTTAGTGESAGSGVASSTNQLPDDGTEATSPGSTAPSGTSGAPGESTRPGPAPSSGTAASADGSTGSATRPDRTGAVDWTTPAVTNRPSETKPPLPTGRAGSPLIAARRSDSTDRANPDRAETTDSDAAGASPAGGEQRRAIAPRQDQGERSSALEMSFAQPAPARPSVTRVPDGHRGDAESPVTPRRRRKPPRSPAVGLIGLLLFTFIATFFAWFSAGPLWLSLGHSQHGVATVANCPVAGIDKRCARFTADGGSFTATVTLLGPAGARAADGATIPAEMVSRSNTIAYAGDPTSLYLRWIPGLMIVLLCGFGIAWITGSYRLPRRRSRFVAVAMSLAGPILIALGMLAVTWQ
jgi:hypothetical protein